MMKIRKGHMLSDTVSTQLVQYSVRQALTSSAATAVRVALCRSCANFRSSLTELVSAVYSFFRLSRARVLLSVMVAADCRKRTLSASVLMSSDRVESGAILQQRGQAVQPFNKSFGYIKQSLLMFTIVARNQPTRLGGDVASQSADARWETSCCREAWPVKVHTLQITAMKRIQSDKPVE